MRTFIETHIIYVRVDESQLGQSPDVMKVGLGSRSTWRETLTSPVWLLL